MGYNPSGVFHLLILGESNIQTRPGKLTYHSTAPDQWPKSYGNSGTCWCSVGNDLPGVGNQPGIAFIFFHLSSPAYRTSKYAEPRVLDTGLLVNSQLKGKEQVMADPETQEESQWIVPQRILSALTIPGFN